jgi:hypothetical protein
LHIPFLCGEHDGTIIFPLKLLEKLENLKNGKISIFPKVFIKNNSAIVFGFLVSEIWALKEK